VQGRGWHAVHAAFFPGGEWEVVVKEGKGKFFSQSAGEGKEPNSNFLFFRKKEEEKIEHIHNGKTQKERK
jgi:hypothetical protein